MVSVLDHLLLCNQPALLGVMVAVADEASVFLAVAGCVAPRRFRVPWVVAFEAVSPGYVILDAHTESPSGLDVQPPCIHCTVVGMEITQIVYLKI